MAALYCLSAVLLFFGGRDLCHGTREIEIFNAEEWHFDSAKKLQILSGDVVVRIGLIELTAERVELGLGEKEGQFTRAEASGEAKVRVGSQTATAEKFVYDRGSSKFRLEGGVTLDRGTDWIHAETIEMDPDTMGFRAKGKVCGVFGARESMDELKILERATSWTHDPEGKRDVFEGKVRLTISQETIDAETIVLYMNEEATRPFVAVAEKHVEIEGNGWQGTCRKLTICGPGTAGRRFCLAGDASIKRGKKRLRGEALLFIPAEDVLTRKKGRIAAECHCQEENVSQPREYAP